MESKADIQKYYDQKAQQEWDRLERHRTEFAVTMRAFEEYLPKPPAKVSGYRRRSR